jgi:hypothetical protein
MIIKGKAVGGAARLAVHLSRADTNESVKVEELRDVAAQDLRGALLEMEALGAGTRTTKPLYHASINTPIHERLTDEQRAHAIERLEKELGLTGQPRAVVIHEKKDREHIHIVWGRIDLEHMRAISDSHNYRKHEEVSRELEREFGHARVQGAHAEREDTPRPKRTPSHAEMLQAERTGISPQQVTDQVTALWRSTDNGQSFAAALSDAGYVLARGDRRDFVIIDPMGGTHSLARRVEGARVKDIRERMADFDPGQLPSVAEAKAIQREGPAESVRIDEEERSKRRTPDGQEWTDRAGMVYQQRAAMDWVRTSHQQKAARTEQTDHRQETNEAELAKMERRYALLREFGREVSEEEAHDLDPGRERTRR